MSQEPEGPSAYAADKDTIEAVEDIDALPELTEEMLTTELGKSSTQVASQEISQGKVTPVRMPDLEGRTWRAPMHLIDANPLQPRRAFRGIEELARSIQTSGQGRDLILVPGVNDNGRIRLVILGGERRFKALQRLEATHAKAEIGSAQSERELLTAAYIDNFHDPLTVIEKADTLNRLIELEQQTAGNGTGQIMCKTVAARMGIEEDKARELLRMLSFVRRYPRLEELVSNGDLSETNLLLLLKRPRMGKPSSERADEDAAFIDLAIENLFKRLDGKKPDRKKGKSDRETKAITSLDVAAARGTVLPLVVGDEEAMAKEAARAVEGIRSAVATLARRLVNLETMERPVALTAIGELKQPPEVLRRTVEIAMRRLAMLHALTQMKILSAEGMEFPTGKTFYDFVAGKGYRAFSSKFRFFIARAIAELIGEEGMADVGLIEITEHLNRDPEATEAVGETDVSLLTSHLVALRADLGKLGIVLTEVYRRVMKTGERGKMEMRSIPHYGMRFTETTRPDEKLEEEEAAEETVPEEPQKINCHIYGDDERLERAGERIVKEILRTIYGSEPVPIEANTEFGEKPGLKIIQSGGPRSFVVASNISEWLLQMGQYTAAVAGIVRDEKGLPEASVVFRQLDDPSKTRSNGGVQRPQKPGRLSHGEKLRRRGVFKGGRPYRR